MRLESDAVLDRAAQLKAEGKPFALVTVVRAVSPTSAKPGAKAVVEADGVIQGWIGGGCAQPAVIKTAQKALQDGQARLIRISPEKDGIVEEGITDFGMTCHSGGTLDIFIDPVMARPELLVIGGSPAAQALVALAQRVGFAVTAAFPGADSNLFPEAALIIDGLAVASRPAFVVVATQGKRDEQGLEAALQVGAPYTAFIASERKAEKLKAYLKECGHEAARVDAIIAPAGIEIDAVTPEEIALSVLAGVVKARRGGRAAQSASATAGKAASCCGSKAAASAPKLVLGSGCCGSDSARAGTAIDPICGMEVQTAGAEYHSVHQGKDYYFCCGGCQHRFEREPERYLKT